MGEIESVLSQHEKVTGAVVLAKVLNGQEKELVAYTTGVVEAAELKSFLKEKLPSYMVPSYYVGLEEIPLTRNGKVNKNALPDPDGTGLSQSSYVSPTTDIEKSLVKIWSEVLGVSEETLSIESDFFDLGGHSIKAIKLLGHVHKNLGVKVALKDLFSNPTIHLLSTQIETSQQEVYNAIVPIGPQDDYAVSSSQRRLWVLNKFEGAQIAYNIPDVRILKGGLNEVAFQNAYATLLSRHEVLRTVFTEQEDGAPRQVILPTEDLRFQVIKEDYSADKQREESINQRVAEEIGKGFDLEQGPLIRCHLLKQSEEEYVWVLVMHHIVSDGWSMGVMYRELSELYNSEVENRPPSLQAPKLQYKDYAAWHNEQLAGEQVQHHKDYWLTQFAGDLPVLELPSDKSRPKVMTYHGSSIYRQLDKTSTDNLKKLGQQEGGTLFMTLLTCVNILLHKYTQQEEIVIGSPIVGREHPDLEDQIGFYINTLALRSRFTPYHTGTLPNYKG